MRKLSDAEKKVLIDYSSEIKENQKMLDILNPIMDEFSEIRDKINNEISRGTSKFNEKISVLESITDKYELNVSMGGFGQSPAPYKNSWQNRVFADAVQKAVEQGHTYLTWTTGKRSAEMANIDQHFNSVKVRYTKDKFLNKDASNQYSVLAIDKNGQPTRKSTDEDGLKKLIGKDYAKEAIDRLNSEMKEVELTDIKVPHQGRRLLYDTIIPSVAKRMAKIFGTRPPTKAKIILQENAIAPKYGEKAGHKTQEVWVMELPIGKDKLHELPLYMPSLMPQQNIPQANTNIMNRLQGSYFTMPKMRVGASKASQARDLEPENSYFNN
jgi:hypothetical protein